MTFRIPAEEYRNIIGGNKNVNRACENQRLIVKRNNVCDTEQPYPAACSSREKRFPVFCDRGSEPFADVADEARKSPPSGVPMQAISKVSLNGFHAERKDVMIVF